MDQKKTGKFILDLRKEMNMTQKELAEKLGVTDRAVSKWENGRGMPELSLMKPLCDVLGITLNELLSGERIDQKDYRDKSESNFLHTIDYTDRKIKKKTTLLRVSVTAIIALAIFVFLLVYLLPVTKTYFRLDEDMEIFNVVKTLPIAPEGEPVDRDSGTDFIDQEITEKVDVESLEKLLPLMRMTVYKETLDWYLTGDCTYEIFGYFKSGPRKGQTFTIMLGDDDWGYLRHHSDKRQYTVVNTDIWMRIMEMLEGWNSDARENFQWENHSLSLYYQGALYNGQGVLRKIPEDVQFVGYVSDISATPDEELECSFGTQGNIVCTWETAEQTYLGIQVDAEHAFSLAKESEQ